jgi:hypothetical protein
MGVVEYVDANEIVVQIQLTKDEKLVSFDGEVETL